ncbi:hypothetical protein N8865_00025 [Francisellaceae bacterium]|nr:hypothetical protein [Francisellaceae bacterium]
MTTIFISILCLALLFGLFDIFHSRNTHFVILFVCAFIGFCFFDDILLWGGVFLASVLIEAIAFSVVEELKAPAEENY